MTVFDALPYSICNQVFGAARSVEACTVILVANGLGLILGSLFGKFPSHVFVIVVVVLNHETK